MFYNCSTITTINLGSFETKKGSNFRYMFNSCSKLEFLNLTNFNTINGRQLDNIFDGCNSLNIIINQEYCSNIIDSIPDYVNKTYI